LSEFRLMTLICGVVNTEGRFLKNTEGPYWTATGRWKKRSVFVNATGISVPQSAVCCRASVTYSGDLLVAQMENSFTPGKTMEEMKAMSLNVQFFQWIHDGAGTRPYMVGLCTPLFPHGPETSFPSDHATLMFAAAFFLLMGRRWLACGLLLLTVTVLTAWGRVYAGIHFPFDIAGSLVVGLGSVGLMRLVAKPLQPLNERLIRIVDQLTSRLVRLKKRRARVG
jgi:hypothetical protein